MWKMWRNRETNKNELLAGFCLLFAIGGIMLAGFGTKVSDNTSGTFGDWARRLTDDWGNVEYSEGETIPLTQEEQGWRTQEEQGKATQEEQGQTMSQGQEQPTQGEQEQPTSQEQEQTAQSEEGETAITIVTEGIVVVQPGDSLWRIAEGCLGDGSQYIAIYDQNRELIGDDPRFIMPGMKLNLDGIK